MREGFASRGLQVNAAKCELRGPCLGVGLRPHLPLHCPGVRDLDGVQLVPFTSESGVVVPGSPVVHPESSGQFSRWVWRDRLRTMNATCAALSRLPQAHIQFTILRDCLDACKV